MSIPTETPLSSSFVITTADLTDKAIRWLRVGLGLRAVLSIALGVFLLAAPATSLQIVAILFGLYFLVVGVVRVVLAFASSGLSVGTRIIGILLGALLIVAGIIAFKNPEVTLITLAILIGISWIIDGIAGIAETADDSSKWFGTLLAAISIVAGLYVIFVPHASLSLLVLFSGIALVLVGIFQLITAFTFGRASK